MERRVPEASLLGKEAEVMHSSGGIRAARTARHGRSAVLAEMMTPVSFKQGRVASAASHPRVVAPAIAADCSFRLFVIKPKNNLFPDPRLATGERVSRLT